MQDRGNNLQNVCRFNRLMKRCPAAGESRRETVLNPAAGRFFISRRGGYRDGAGKNENKKKIFDGTAK